MQVIHEVLQEMLVIKTLINKNRDLLHLVKLSNRFPTDTGFC